MQRANDALIEAKEKIGRELAKRLKKVKKQISHFIKEWESGRGWAEEVRTAELLQVYFFRLKKGLREIEIEDWEQEGRVKKIELDPELEPAEELKRHFILGRKLKRREKVAEEFLKKLIRQGAELELAISRVEAASLLEELEGYRVVLKEKGKVLKKAHPFREFTTQKGLKIYAGKSDRDNEKLTFRVAHGSDFWLHAGNYPGSHVVLKVKKGESPDEDSLLDAIQIALYYSKAKEAGEDEVIVAECKYISKSKGSKPGLVNVSKHKRIRAKLDPEKIKRLLLSGESKQVLP